MLVAPVLTYRGESGPTSGFVDIIAEGLIVDANPVVMDYLDTVQEDDFLVVYVGGPENSAVSFALTFTDEGDTPFEYYNGVGGGGGGGGTPSVVLYAGKASEAIVAGHLTATPSFNAFLDVCPILVLRFRSISGADNGFFAAGTGQSALAETSDPPANGIFANVLWASGVSVGCNSGVAITPDADWTMPTGGRKQGGSGAAEVSLVALYQFKTVDEDTVSSAVIGSSKHWAINVYGWEN